MSKMQITILEQTKKEGERQMNKKLLSPKAGILVQTRDRLQGTRYRPLGQVLTRRRPLMDTVYLGF